MAAARPPTQSYEREVRTLPPDWERHWSVEWTLEYYWNSRTGESTWTRPLGVLLGSIRVHQYWCRGCGMWHDCING